MMLGLSVPSKTFLCGEYLALQGGPAVILATDPRFSLKVASKAGLGATREDSSFTATQFHKDSAAGKFLAARPSLTENYLFDFKAPVEGGFGGSSAEFVLLSAFEQLKSPLNTESQLDLDLKKTLSDYHLVHETDVIKPSGADIVGQAQGFVTAFNRKAGRIQTFGWGFPNLQFAVFRTGRKLATHDHLKSLNLGTTAVEKLEASCFQVWEGLNQISESHLAVGLTEFALGLDTLGLQDPGTMKVTKELRKLSGVRAVKGCGAMGVDAILVLFDHREVHLSEVQKAALGHGLQYFANQDNLTKGLQKDPFQGVRQ